MARPDANATGQAFVRHMMWLLAAGMVLYVALHWVLPDQPPSGAPGCTAELSWSCFGEVDELGDVHFLNPGDVHWYVGVQTAAAVRDLTHLNSQRMDELRRRVIVNAGGRIAPLLIDRAPVDALIREVASGRYGEASSTFEEIVGSLSTLSANGAAIELAETAADLDRLTTLRHRQQGLVERLTPPLSRLFFWTSPAYSMIEVLFWALFGVLTNLLVNATEYLRKGDFHPPERWVAYTKLMYGPILALILVFAMINGFFQPDSYEIRVWTLPLVSFIFGYGSRRTARVIDQVLERFMGAAEQAARVGPGPVTAKRRELVSRLMEAYRPTDLRELRSQLKNLAREVVETEASGREER